uniref:Uncharacterized protein n=2 Tax=Odontella aurita TaxID=265563 RepID=A0A7S4NFU3_9STRA|mmetsp:Transcript_62383/g.184589  ORF Transcript_62383/g.184589 Transcript_62383/m.184589 type:complete len:1158 (+) Transcript_62383:266-3739(+)
MDIFLLIDPSSFGERCNGNENPRPIASKGYRLKRLIQGPTPRRSIIRGSYVKRHFDQHVPKLSNSQSDNYQHRKKLSSSENVTRKISQRLAEAERRRRNLHDSRVRALRDRSVARLSAAQRRAERLKLMKINKARLETNVRVAEVRERRARLLEDEKVAIIAVSETRERDAIRRAEQTLQSRAKKARSDAEERAERVRDRRALLECERRAALLASLDYRYRRASRNLRRSLDGRRERASFDVRHAAEVSTRVKAVRAIQRAARESFDFPSPFSSVESRSEPEISQKEAAKRLQGWYCWRIHVSAARFRAAEVNIKDNAPTSSLKTLLNMVEPGEGESKQASFERIRLIMSNQETLRAAKAFLHFIRPLVQLQEHARELNDRILLSAFLITEHPDEVLGGDQENDNRAIMLFKSSKKLVTAIRSLSDGLGQRDDTPMFDKIRDVTISLTAYTALFHLWKNADLDSLVKQMVASATQSWFAYLTSNEVIKYVEGRTLGDGPPSPWSHSNNKGAPSKKIVDDPLLPVRLRHEAQFSGSKSHIKRIRVSLNKLVGIEEGRRLIRVARDTASGQLKTQDTVAILKEEVDELLDGERVSTPAPDSMPPRTEDYTTACSNSAEDSNGANENRQKNSQSGEEVTRMSTSGINVESVTSEVLSNEQLVHSILLTEPTNFDQLTWDGNQAHNDILFNDFMSSWEQMIQETVLSEGASGSLNTPKQFQRHVADTTTAAFFAHITDEMTHGKFGPISNLLIDLHNSMRQLVPARIDLHSYLSDEDAEQVTSCEDILLLLKRAAIMLAEYLEAPPRAQSTQSWIARAEVFSAVAETSPEHFVAASISFLLLQVELTKTDVANFKLRQVAPLIRQRGQQYEVDKIQQKYGPLVFTSTVSLTEKLPATAAWIASSISTSSELTGTSSYEKRMMLVRTRGFVDGLLFTKESLAVPELLEMDTMRVMKIRSEARFSVIGSALVIHACNISGAGASLLRHVPLPSAVVAQKDMIARTVRAKYTSKEEITDATKAFAEGLKGESLDDKSETELCSYVAAVISGDDPVLKLLDNRIKQLFRFACRWEPIKGLNQPVPMKTGRTILKDGAPAGIVANSFSALSGSSAAAHKEACRLGFTLFANELAKAGEDARAVISHCCKQYGKIILDQLLVDAIWG